MDTNHLPTANSTPGSSPVTCNKGGAWSVQNLPVCQQRICSSIIPNENTTMTSTGVLCGDKTVFKCKEGKQQKLAAKKQKGSGRKVLSC